MFAFLFPEGEARTWLKVVQVIAIIGGCSCELLLSKQSKWAFIVSFFLYDITQIIVYFANGYYISALFEIIFWIPILFISFYLWNKKSDKDNKNLTQVKEVNWKRDVLIFVVVLAVSVGTGLMFTSIGAIAEGMPDWWYLDALANTFSVCNGLFLIFRFKEQWIPWIGVALVEAVMWILSGQYIMLILSIGYLMNSLYGFIMWTKYVKKHKEEPVKVADKNDDSTENATSTNTNNKAEIYDKILNEDEQKNNQNETEQSENQSDLDAKKQDEKSINQKEEKQENIVKQEKPKTSAKNQTKAKKSNSKKSNQTTKKPETKVEAKKPSTKTESKKSEENWF